MSKREVPSVIRVCVAFKYPGSYAGCMRIQSMPLLLQSVLNMDGFLDQTVIEQGMMLILFFNLLIVVEYQESMRVVVYFVGRNSVGVHVGDLLFQIVEVSSYDIIL